MTGDDTVTSTVVWEGIEIEITYAAKSILNQAHLELRVPSKAKIPVTDTGYRSEFLHPGEVEEQGGPGAYVIAWLDYLAQSREWKAQAEQSRQYTLF